MREENQKERKRINDGDKGRVKAEERGRLMEKRETVKGQERGSVRESKKKSKGEQERREKESKILIEEEGK